VRCLLSAGRCVVHDAARERPPTPLRGLLAQACQPRWLVARYDLYRRFTSVHHPDDRALTRMGLPGGDSSPEVSPAGVTCFGTWSRSRLIHPGRCPWWHRWFPIYPMGTTPRSDFLSQPTSRFSGGAERRPLQPVVRWRGNVTTKMRTITSSSRATRSYLPE